MLSSSTSTSAWKYDVFLSFRTADTIDFANNLYRALEQRRLRTFAEVDEEQPSWLEIKSSRIAIIVFSKDYASSTWRLEELRNIMKCRRTQAQPVVMGIFYNVSLENVLHLGGSYGEAMQRHERKLGNGAPVSKWRRALKAVVLRFNTKSDGFVRLPYYQPESMLIEKIVVRVHVAACEYDVFLSFRAADSYGFTTNLNQALEQAGIRTFAEDDKEQPSLAQIQRSRMAIIVFSKDYASSTRRLDELLNIMECQRTQAQLVLPIFYNVSLSDVRHQTGTYGEAMKRHEQNLGNGDLVSKWRRQLMAVVRGFINKSDGFVLLPPYQEDHIIINDVVKRVRHALTHMD